MPLIHGNAWTAHTVVLIYPLSACQHNISLSNLLVLSAFLIVANSSWFGYLIYCLHTYNDEKGYNGTTVSIHRQVGRMSQTDLRNGILKNSFETFRTVQ